MSSSNNSISGSSRTRSCTYDGEDGFVVGDGSVVGIVVAGESAGGAGRSNDIKGRNKDAIKIKRGAFYIPRKLPTRE